MATQQADATESVATTPVNTHIVLFRRAIKGVRAEAEAETRGSIGATGGDRLGTTEQEPQSTTSPPVNNAIKPPVRSPLQSTQRQVSHATTQMFWCEHSSDQYLYVAVSGGAQKKKRRRKHAVGSCHDSTRPQTGIQTTQPRFCTAGTKKPAWYTANFIF